MQIFWARLIKSMFFFWSLRNQLILARARQELIIIKTKLQLQMTCKLLAIAFAVIGTEGLKLQEEANELSQAQRGWGKLFGGAAKDIASGVAEEVATTAATEAASSAWSWFAQNQANAE